MNSPTFTERLFHALRFAACVLILQSISVHLEAQGLQQVKLAVFFIHLFLEMLRKRYGIMESFITLISML